MNKQRLSPIQNRIQEIKKELLHIGEMRPGSLTQQTRVSADRACAYWQLSYTHKMKSRTDYVRADHVTKTKAQVKNFKRFKKLVDDWIDLAIEYAKLKIKLGLD